MNYERFLLFVTLCLGCSTAAHAQNADSATTRYGAYVGVNINLPIASFSVLPTVPSCCPGFTGGLGAGMAAGVLAEFPVGRLWLLGLRAGYDNRYATLKSSEATAVIVSDTLAEGEFTHTLVSHLAYLTISPYLTFTPSRRFTAFVGLTGGSPVTATYDQREEITRPDDRGTFINGSRLRNVSSGKIPQVNAFDLALMFGASLDFPMNRDRTMFIAPELTYSISMVPVISGVTWNTSALRLGAVLRYTPPPVLVASPSALPPPGSGGSH